MRKPVLSRRQQGILRFLYSYSQDNGFYPTIREICEGTQTSSTSVVKYHLEQLVEMGYLNHSPRRSRSNTLSQKAYELLHFRQCPLPFATKHQTIVFTAPTPAEKTVVCFGWIYQPMGLEIMDIRNVSTTCCKESQMAAIWRPARRFDILLRFRDSMQTPHLTVEHHQSIHCPDQQIPSIR